MLKQLQFVRGAVGKGKIDAGLSHFRIRDRRVTGFNGVLAISSPIPVDLDCQPDAATLIKAVGNCKAAVELSMTEGGKLRLRSGTFRVFIESFNETLPEVQPEGEMVEVNGQLIVEAMKKLVEFVGDDASRPWTNGILFRGKSAFATNNLILAQVLVGGKDESVFPEEANVPLLTVKELLRVGDPPTHVSMSPTSMTFHFTEDRWIRTQLYDTNWPDVEAMLPTGKTPMTTLPTGFWDAVETCMPFKDKQSRVYLGADSVSTSLEDETGSHVRVPGVAEGVFNIDQLWALREHIEKVDLNTNPAPFMGNKLRGVLVGMLR